jgi:hypothetical protein
MAGASLNSFGKFTTGYFKGVLVDIPTAAADGFRHVSQVYGDKPKEYGTVTDWKSGAKVGSKNFVGGMKEGITGLVKHPWKGYQEDGRQGALRGLAKGAIGVATKASSGKTLNLVRFSGRETLSLTIMQLESGYGLIPRRALRGVLKQSSEERLARQLSLHGLWMAMLRLLRCSCRRK